MKGTTVKSRRIIIAATLMALSTPLRADDSLSSSMGDEASALYSRFKTSVFTVISYCPKTGDEHISTSESEQWVCRVGTAVPIDTSGYLITLNSVVKNSHKTILTSFSGDTLPARVIGTDATGNIGVLKIDGYTMPVIPDIALLSDVTSGEKVYCLGVGPGMEIAVTRGLVCAVHQSDGVFEMSTADSPGTSGTPVFNVDGKIVGMLAYLVNDDSTDKSVSSDTQPVNTCIVLSIEHASILAHSVISSTDFHYGWLGLAVKLDKTQNGVSVNTIVDNGPASKSGVRPNDAIIDINGNSIQTTHDLRATLSKTHVGDTIRMTVLRAGKSVSFDVHLSKRPVGLPQ